MFNTRQYSSGEAVLSSPATALFSSARITGLPGGAECIDIDRQVRGEQPSTAQPVAPDAAVPPTLDDEVVIWYRAKRVWLAAALLLGAVTFRLAAVQDSSSMQSVKIQSVDVSEPAPSGR